MNEKTKQALITERKTATPTRQYRIDRLLEAAESDHRPRIHIVPGCITKFFLPATETKEEEEEEE